MLNNIIIEMDADGNGDIPFEDFAAVMATKMYFPHSVNAFREACKMFDDNDNGKLYVSDLRFAMEELVPFPMSHEETDYMVKSQGDKESMEGIDAFLEKRTPDYKKLR